MQLESHASPQVETPQQRYASLHRAIERGLRSDELWKELADVSLRLGHGEEAVHCLNRIRNEAMHAALESRLVRLKLVEREAPPAAAEDHVVAPAASHAGNLSAALQDGHPAGLRDHFVDALQYLFHQHMPWLVLTTTLAFPLVIGVGGFLTAGGSLLLLAAIAALPGLGVMAVVGAMGRQILVASSEGLSDVPPVPEFSVLLADARRFLLDAVLVLGSLIAPSLLALALGAPITTTLPCLMIGGFFTPIAWAVRQVRGDLGALSPVVLLRSANRCGSKYLGIVAMTWLLLAPAGLVAWAVFGRPIWVQLAVIGPLCVLPIFALSRLLGTWLDSNRLQLGSVLLRTPTSKSEPKETSVAAPAATTHTPAATKAPAVAAPRQPRRPAHLEHFVAPAAPGRQARPVAARPTVAPVTKTTAPAAPGPVRATPPRAPAAAAPRTTTNKAEAPKAKPTPAAPRAAAPSAAPSPTPRPVEPRAIEGRGPNRPARAEDVPDLANLPGAVVVSGRERARLGAAARKQ